MVDSHVYRIFTEKREDISELTREHKANLSGLLTKMCFNGEGESPFCNLLQQVVWDLVNIYRTKEVKFSFVNYFQGEKY